MMARSSEAEKRPGGKTNQAGFNNKKKKKEKSGNGKMGRLNKGNKEVSFLLLLLLLLFAIRVIFRTYECEFKMQQSVRHGIRFQYSIHIFLLKGEARGLVASLGFFLTIYGNLCISEYLAARSITF